MYDIKLQAVHVLIEIIILIKRSCKNVSMFNIYTPFYPRLTSYREHVKNTPERGTAQSIKLHSSQMNDQVTLHVLLGSRSDIIGYVA